MHRCPVEVAPRSIPGRSPRSRSPRPGVDVEEFDWSPDGGRIAFAALREDHGWWSAVSVVDVAGGDERRIQPGDAWECAPRWLADGGLTLLSDADGWFQVIRLDAALRERSHLTAGPIEHGEPSGPSASCRSRRPTGPASSTSRSTMRSSTSWWPRWPPRPRSAVRGVARRSIPVRRPRPTASEWS